ncbi:MAG TPA: hypothetical protein VM513_32220 [Kofleriaceae bacterium]|nr:hypothetical protein [Kofleriaceae bacterium]
MTGWQFATTPTRPRSPEVVLVAFGRGALPGPIELPAGCTLRTIARAVSPAWFDAWRQGSLRAIAEQDLGPQIAELDATDHAHVIASAPVAPVDLAYLHAAWSAARALVARGASIVLDAHAMTYVPAAKLPAVDAPLEVAREVRLVYETTATRAEGAHALHTRGLRKFGAPDLVALCTDADARIVGHALAELADAVARGTELATPRHAIHVAPGVTWVAIEDEHRLGALLQLDNEVRVIVDATGHHLTGVLARLPVLS